ncbi:MAG TPA: carboxypeptidase-like regulatory domain-containing protein [Bacteroidales bacterium]|nr:carboxypeptidase-like regulatory domain-containing protein [Bacteroidales bacterium]
MSFRWVIISILFLQCSIQLTAQANRTINLCFENIEIAKAIDTISGKYHVNFSYNAELDVLKKKKKVCGEYTLSSALQALLNGENTGYSIISNTVVLFQLITPDADSIQNISPPKPEFIDITGKISNATDKSPISYASVSVNKYPISTVCNNDGYFKLRLPERYYNDTIVISSIGYMQEKIAVSDFNGQIRNIKLFESVVNINPVIIKQISAENIVKESLSRIKNNFCQRKAVYTSYYRETIKENEEYYSVAEGVLNIAKAPYNSHTQIDQVKIFKARKNENKLKLTSVIYKLEGGVANCVKMDIVKDEAPFYSSEAFNTYKYQVDRMDNYNGRLLYIISFKPYSDTEDLTYTGKLYIDKESFALVAATFKLSPSGLERATQLLVKKTPRKTRIKPYNTDYRVFYREINGKWFLDFTYTGIELKARSKIIGFNSTFSAISQMVVNNIDTTNTERYKYRDISKVQDIFTEQIGEPDKNFWGECNIIEPEESLLEAIKRIRVESVQTKSQGFWQKIFGL